MSSSSREGTAGRSNAFCRSALWNRKSDASRLAMSKSRSGIAPLRPTDMEAQGEMARGRSEREWRARPATQGVVRRSDDRGGSDSCGASPESALMSCFTRAAVAGARSRSRRS